MKRSVWTSWGTRWALLWACIGALYAIPIMLLDPDLEGVEAPVTEAMLALGTGLLLGVRINRAYERWWEGRQLWGTLVNVSRNLAVKAKEFARLDAEESADLAGLIAGFAYSLKDHLRQGARLQDTPGFENREETPNHVPQWFAARVYARLHTWVEAGRITPEEMRTIDREARVLLDVCGACERIRNTLMPPSLAGLTRFIMFMVVIGFPLIAEERLGWYTILGTAGVTFFLVIGETTATIIERPFGTDVNQLDLDRLCTTIRDSTAETLGVS